MAQVFAARHPVFERPVALKVLKREVCHDGRFVARFLDDARSAHRLDHPNVVRVLDVDETDRQPFIVMDLVEGLPLDRWLSRRRVEVSEAVSIARDVARALAAAHSAGMVHRDVKPANILIDRHTGTAKLTDFGAAKRDRPGGLKWTEKGDQIGTPRYMAPEQVDGSADARTDLFALSATLYELLAGAPAFEGDTVGVVYRAILFGEPQSLAERRPELPPELVGLVSQLLAKASSDRPATAQEVVAALDAISNRMSSAAQLSSAMTVPAQRTSDKGTPSRRGVMFRSRLMPLAVGAVLLLALGIGTWFWSSQPALDCPADLATAPGCALAAQALRAIGGSAAIKPELTLNQPDGIYLDQQYLVVEAEMPADVRGYLYLDVLTDAGQVFHLLPEPMRVDNALPAGGDIRVGVEEGERAAGVRHWQIAEPFGDGYLLATVSEEPLYDGLRPLEESIADYREVLLQALADPGTGRKAARVERLEFRPRP